MPKINWKEYNEKLVKRGEILFSTEFIENWKRELNLMNKRKRGHPYEYLNTQQRNTQNKAKENLSKGIYFNYLTLFGIKKTFSLLFSGS